ncbi:MAG TPA: T9SS type A sorting domain-containing protein [Ignavibacteria bacterium]|nr:T9SS type A sorting domain-containing protein [Ignavibacteria bacterium]
MKFVITCFVLSVFSTIVFPQQSQWKTFYSGNQIHSISTRGNDLWVGTNFGLAHIDLTTDQIQLYDKTNTKQALNDTRYVYIRKNGDLLLNSYNNFGFTYYNGAAWYDRGTLYNITGIIETNGDSIWVSSKYSGIEQYYIPNIFSVRSTLILNSKNSELPTNNVSDMKFDKEGNLWIATFEYDFRNTNLGGVSKFDGNNWTIYNQNNSPIPTDQITKIEFDKNGNLWIGTNGKGLIEYTGNDWIRYDTLSLSPLTRVADISAISVDSLNNIWVGTMWNGLLKFDGSKWEIFNGANSNLRSNMIRALRTDNRGRLWVGTLVGLYRFENGNFKEFNTSNSILPSTKNLDAIKDSKGNIWFISMDYGSPYNSDKTNNGIVEYDGTEFRFYSAKEISSFNESFLTITADPWGNIWAANLGGLYKYDGNKWYQYYHYLRDKFQPSKISADYLGNIWIGTYDGNLVKFDGKDFIEYLSKDYMLPNSSIRGMTADALNLYISFNEPTDFIIKIDISKSSTNLVFDNIIQPPTQVNDLVKDSYGNLWAGTTSGLRKYNGIEWITYNKTNSGILGDDVISVTTSGKNVYTISRNEYSIGLSVFDGDTWKNYTYNNSDLALKYFSSVQIDKNNNVWLVGNGGVSILNSNGVELNWTLEKTNNNKLFQNFPNPGNPNTIIKYIINKKSNVTLKVYDILGREIVTLLNQTVGKGTHFISWNGKNSLGKYVSSGIYIYNIVSDNFTDSKKMIILK